MELTVKKILSSEQGAGNRTVELRVDPFCGTPHPRPDQKVPI